MAVLSKLASLGSSKRLFEGSFSRSLKRVDSRIDSPSRPKTPAGAKKGAKLSNSWSDFVPALGGGGRASQVDRRSVQQPAAAEVQAELPPTSEDSAEHRDESDAGNDDDSRRD